MGLSSLQYSAGPPIGNSNPTPRPVNRLYTSEYTSNLCSTPPLSFSSNTTLVTLLPSSFVRVLFPTISTGYTKSVRMASCTAVKVRERGRFWVCEVRERFERLGRGRMRREARNMTWRSENFFSSSRVRLGEDVSGWYKERVKRRWEVGVRAERRNGMKGGGGV